MYTWAQLKEMWQHDKITVEQVIGQLLVWGEQEEAQFKQEQRRREALEDEVTQLQKAVKGLQGR